MDHSVEAGVGGETCGLANWQCQLRLRFLAEQTPFCQFFETVGDVMRYGGGKGRDARVLALMVRSDVVWGMDLPKFRGLKWARVANRHR